MLTTEGPAIRWNLGLAKTSACAGLLAHLVTSKYVDPLATIAKTNRIRLRHLGRRWNGNHQPR